MDHHPSSLDHSPGTLRRIAEACEYASHDPRKADFDNLQTAANLLSDWASLREGNRLVGLDGTQYPLDMAKSDNEK